MRLDADILVSHQSAISDTTRIAQRNFDETRISDLRSHPDLDYSVDRSQGTTLWQRLRRWLKEFFMALFYAGSQNSIFKIMIYALLTGVLIFAGLKLLNANPVKIIQKKSSGAMPYEVIEDDIHTIPFEAQIEVAVLEGDYKLVVRLYYLFALKILADGQLINWIPGKSNLEYQYDLKDKSTKFHFRQLSNLFEYAWYGGYEVGPSISKRTVDNFKNLRKSIDR